MSIKNSLTALAITFGVALQGCVVEPVSPYQQRHVQYIPPMYPAPGPGWQWQHHDEHGWGWRHEEQGWHQGWGETRERGHDHDREHDRGRY